MLMDKINDLRNSEIREVIDKRVEEFNSFKNKTSKEIFSEMCFCFMTANFSANGGIKIQNAVGEGFFVLPEDLLAFQLKTLGHRFPNARARFVVEARRYMNNIKDILEEFKSDFERREFLVKNVKGLGYKEASHFLRNIGYGDAAIIDFHIIDLLVKENLVERPKSKSLTKNKYLEIENVLRDLSDKTGIGLGELDLYLWYMETGKILK
ncbi:MAG: N-glycosylase/DNA lyase [Nanoarchaeota archaeon]